MWVVCYTFFSGRIKSYIFQLKDVHYFCDYPEASLIVPMKKSTPLQKIKSKHGVMEFKAEGSLNHPPLLNAEANVCKQTMLCITSLLSLPFRTFPVLLYINILRCPKHSMELQVKLTIQTGKLVTTCTLHLACWSHVHVVIYTGITFDLCLRTQTIDSVCGSM